MIKRVYQESPAAFRSLTNFKTQIKWKSNTFISDRNRGCGPWVFMTQMESGTRKVTITILKKQRKELHGLMDRSNISFFNILKLIPLSDVPGGADKRRGGSRRNPNNPGEMTVMAYLLKSRTG